MSRCTGECIDRFMGGYVVSSRGMAIIEASLPTQCVVSLMGIISKFFGVPSVMHM